MLKTSCRDLTMENISWSLTIYTMYCTNCSLSSLRFTESNITYELLVPPNKMWPAQSTRYFKGAFHLFVQCQSEPVRHLDRQVRHSEFYLQAELLTEPQQRPVHSPLLLSSLPPDEVFQVLDSLATIWLKESIQVSQRSGHHPCLSDDDQLSLEITG